ncbi:MAG TPA: hypothetical protein VL346_13310 [Acidobacteriaceae bacterium]|nr:hypothetical protein [Acidobacteriaceae bacterium]
MNFSAFHDSLQSATPPAGLTIPMKALWWDARGDWSRAHDLVNDLETPEATAVHAYLHRKEGDMGNADYWYRRAGRNYHRPTLEEEWKALVTDLLTGK